MEETKERDGNLKTTMNAANSKVENTGQKEQS